MQTMKAETDSRVNRFESLPNREFYHNVEKGTG